MVRSKPLDLRWTAQIRIGEGESHWLPEQKEKSTVDMAGDEGACRHTWGRAYGPWRSEPRAQGWRAGHDELIANKIEGGRLGEATTTEALGFGSVAALRARGGSCARVMRGAEGAQDGCGA